MKRGTFMIKTVRQACRFNPVIRDSRISQAIENLAELINDQGNGREFFARNFVTVRHGTTLPGRVAAALGKSDQAVFELTQAMGGGKTHMMIALGLLAKHSQLRKDVLAPYLSARVDVGQARIAAFNGRNNPDNYLWCKIATQLGGAVHQAILGKWSQGRRPA